MTRRHDERWALPIGNDEYIKGLEEEFYRLRQAERTLEATIDFLRSERDRLRDALTDTDDLVRDVRKTLGVAEYRFIDEIERLQRTQRACERIADPEELDANWKAMRKVAKNALAS